jgi:hypothetical protein
VGFTLTLSPKWGCDILWAHLGLKVVCYNLVCKIRKKGGVATLGMKKGFMFIVNMTFKWE